MHIFIIIFLFELIFRHSSVELSYETLYNILNYCDCILRINISKRPDYLILESFIREIYNILSPRYKIKLIENFTIANIFVWRCIGFENLPISQSSAVESLIYKSSKTITLLRQENCTCDDFFYVVSIL